MAEHESDKHESPTLTEDGIPETCANCGEPKVIVDREASGMAQCLECLQSALRHGHLHGLHTDHAWDAEDRRSLEACPECAGARARWDATGRS